MDDERLFEMVDESIAYAQNMLESGTELQPFAMYIESDGTIASLGNAKDDAHTHYENLLEQLQGMAANDKIIAVALLARVEIPENFSPEVSEGLRIHIEEKASSHKKIAGRYLYIPYQVFKDASSGKLSVHLHHPISVGFPAEIF